jgi:hypothetical protein
MSNPESNKKDMVFVAGDIHYFCLEFTRVFPSYDRQKKMRRVFLTTINLMNYRLPGT